MRACYAALRMQERVKQYADEVRRSHAAVVKIRVGLNSGEVVVRAICSDLHMDYTAVGQTTHLAARMEQIADPGAAVITTETLALAEGYVEVKSLGPVPVKGLADPLALLPPPATSISPPPAVTTRSRSQPSGLRLPQCRHLHHRHLAWLRRPPAASITLGRRSRFRIIAPRTPCMICSKRRVPRCRNIGLRLRPIQ